MLEKAIIYLKFLYEKLKPRNQSQRIVWGCLILLFLWFGSGIFRSSSHSTLIESQELIEVPVITSTAIDKNPSLLVSGHTQENRSVILRPETNGQIFEISKPKGSSANRGEPILSITLDDRRAKLTEAQALADQRKLEYQAAHKLAQQNFKSKTGLADAKSKFEGALAHLTTMKKNLDDAKITAPFSGIVENTFVEIGSSVKSGDDLLEFVELNPLKVIANVSETEIDSIKQNQKAKVSLVSGQTVEGLVTYVGTKADDKTRTFRVEVTVPNENMTLKAGVTAEIAFEKPSVKVHKLSGAILLLNDNGILGVHGLSDNNKVVFYPIKILNHENADVYVMNLPEKIRLIERGQEFVTAGQQVQPIELSRKKSLAGHVSENKGG